MAAQQRKRDLKSLSTKDILHKNKYIDGNKNLKVNKNLNDKIAVILEFCVEINY